MTKSTLELRSTARQAVDALRGYRYQLVHSALAWLRLPRDGVLYLEIAEDYAQAIGASLTATQVKATADPITSNTAAVRRAIDEFFDLSSRNLDLTVSVQFLTTSELGTERNSEDRIDGSGALSYWNRVAVGADVAPLRARLEQMHLGDRARAFLATADDETVRNDLVRRIDWVGGAPDLAASLQELKDELVLWGNDRGVLASQSELAHAAILERIFAVASSAGDRRLTAADAIRCFDEAVSVTLPVSILGSGLVDLGRSGGQILHNANPYGLEELGEGLTDRFTARMNLRTRIAGHLRTNRLAWVHGGTGYGKTWLAETVAHEEGKWGVLRLRGLDRREVARLLRFAGSALAGRRMNGLILDDVPASVDARSLAAVLHAAQRTDGAVIATSPEPLPAQVLATLGLSQAANIGVPELDDADLEDLIQRYGGTPGWLPYVRGAGAWGHPQLSHAVVSGLSDRGWPVSEFTEIKWLFGGDPAVDEVRRTARDRLIDELPSEARHLLYRLKVAGPRIDDGMVSALAAVPTPIDLPGEQMHRLVGPWVERTEGLYRVSPLVADASTNLGSEEVRRCHFALAAYLTAGPSLDGGRFDDILLNAFVGENEFAQVVAITALLRSEQSDFEAFIKHSTLLGTITPGQHAMFPATVPGTMLVGVAMIAAAVEGKSERFDALQAEFVARLDEADQAAGIGLRPLFQAKLLFVPGLIDLVDDLPGMILAVQRDTTELTNGETIPETDAAGPYAAKLLAMQMFWARSVAGLKRTVDEIAKLSDADRELLLPGGLPIPFGDGIGSEGLVRAPWLTTIRDGSEMSDGDADGYVELGHSLEGINLTDIAVEAFETAAIHWDETRGLTDRAIAVIDEAEALLGPDVRLIRARARIHYHAGDYAGQEEIADDVDDTRIEPISRTYFLREQAVGRALLGRHEEAADLFGRAASVAEGLDAGNMQAMHLGLLVDRAYSLQLIGQRREALALFLEVERRLVEGGLNRSGRWAAVARTSAHAWLVLTPGFEADKVDELFAGWVFGAASNPVPHEDLLKAPEEEFLPIRPILLGRLEQGWDLDLGHTEAVRRAIEADPHPPSPALLLQTETFVSALRRRSASEVTELAPHVIRAGTFPKTGIGPCRPMAWARQIPLASETSQHIHTAAWAMQALLLTVAEIGATDGPAEARAFIHDVLYGLVPSANPAVHEALLLPRPHSAAGLVGDTSCVGRFLAAMEDGEPPVVEDLHLIVYRLAWLRAKVGRVVVNPPRSVEMVLRTLWTEALRAQRFRLLAPSEAETSIGTVLNDDVADPSWLPRVLSAANPHLKVRVPVEDLPILEARLVRLR